MKPATRGLRAIRGGGTSSFSVDVKSIQSNAGPDGMIVADSGTAWSRLGPGSEPLFVSHQRRTAYPPFALELRIGVGRGVFVERRPAGLAVDAAAFGGIHG